DATYAHVSLVNYGTIFNKAGYGIDFGQTASGTIINEPGALIEGLAAIRTDSASLAITNLGSITGLVTACQMDTTSTATGFVNEGTVFSYLFGITDLSAIGGNT